MQARRIHLTGAERRAMYADMKSRKVGEPCVCPVCGEVFIKRSYQQAFCCTKCKDWYWNRQGDRHSADYAERYAKKVHERFKEWEREQAAKRTDPHWYFDADGVLRYSAPVFNGHEMVWLRAN